MRRRRRKKHTPDQMEQQRRGRKIFRVLGRVLLTGIVMAAAVVAMTVFFRLRPFRWKVPSSTARRS